MHDFSVVLVATGLVIDGLEPALPRGYMCRAMATFPDGGQQDVSGFATWSTSDPSIAVVNETGFVTPLRPGHVDVRAEYTDVGSWIALTIN